MEVKVASAGTLVSAVSRARVVPVVSASLIVVTVVVLAVTTFYDESQTGLSGESQSASFSKANN